MMKQKMDASILTGITILKGNIMDVQDRIKCKNPDEITTAKLLKNIAFLSEKLSKEFSWRLPGSLRNLESDSDSGGDEANN